MKAFLILLFSLLASSLLLPEARKPVKAPLELPETPISYRAKAEPTSRVLSDVGKLAGTNLTVSDQLGHEPLIIQLRNMPLNEAMDRIAYVLNASWTQTKDGYLLSRPQSVQDDLINSETDAKATRLAASIKHRLTITSLAPLTEEAAQAWAESFVNPSETGPVQEEPYRDNGPQARLGRQIYAHLDPNMLAADPYPDYIVFSNRPGPLERKLNISDEEFRAIIDDQNAWTRALREIAKNIKYIGVDSGLHIIDPTDARILATVTVYGDDLTANVSIVNSKNRIYVSALDYASSRWQESDALKDSAKKDFDKLGLKPFNLSPEASEIRALLISHEKRDSDDVRPVKPDVKSLLLDPVKNDPLSFIPSEVLLGMADQKGWNVVARLGDDCVISAGSTGGTQADPAGFLATRVANGYEVSTDSGCITIRPKDPIQTESERCDRGELATFAKSVDTTGYPTVDAEADFLAGHDPGVNTLLPADWTMLLKPKCHSFEDENLNALRFYGLLLPTQRQDLAAGKSLTPSQLGAAQQDALKDWIMSPFDTSVDDSDPDAGLGVEVDDTNSETDPATKERIFWQKSNELLDTLTAAPPPASIVTLTETHGTGIQAKYESNFRRWLTPRDVAQAQEDKINPGMLFRCSTKDDVRLHVSFGNKTELKTVFTSHRESLNDWGPITSLPQDIQKAIQEETQRVNTHSFTIVNADGTTTTGTLSFPPTEPDNTPPVPPR